MADKDWFDLFGKKKKKEQQPKKPGPLSLKGAIDNIKANKKRKKDILDQL